MICMTCYMHVLFSSKQGSMTFIHASRIRDELVRVIGTKMEGLYIEQNICHSHLAKGISLLVALGN